MGFFLGILVHNDCGKFPAQFDKDIKKVLGVSKNELETIKQGVIKKQFTKEMAKIGAKNPDVGISSTGNMLLKNVQTGKIIDTGVPWKYFID